MRRIVSAIVLFLCAAAGAFGQSGTTQITASHIAYFGGATVTGSFCLTPTDASSNPITITTNQGQQIAPQVPLCFPITSGVLSSLAIVPDVTMVQPVNACYKLVINNYYQAQVGVFPCIQPSGNTWSFDSYVPSSLPSIPALTLPQYQVNGTSLTNQAVLNFICPGCTVSGGAITFPSASLPSQAANTLLGNNTGSTATPGGLTVSQVITLLGLGTAATTSASAYDASGAAAAVSTASLQKSANLSDLGSAATARTNLGLGAAAQSALSAFLQPGNNLSELTNLVTARTNLGLGTAAVTAASAYDAAGAATAAQAAALSATAPFTALTDGSAVSWAVGGLSTSNASLTMANTLNTRALNLSGMVTGGHYSLKVFQDSTGGAQMTTGTGCTWVYPTGVTAATFSVQRAPSAFSIVAFQYDGTYCILEPPISQPGGESSTAVGFLALPNITTGINNNAFGWRAGFNVATGNYNDFMGHDAGYAAGASSSNNTAVGEGAMFGNGVPSNNVSNDTAVGTNALLNVQNAYNSAFGYGALQNVGNSQQNTAVGLNACLVTTTGSYNTCLGASTNMASAATTNSTAVGQAAVTTASHQVALGTASETVTAPGGMTSGKPVGGNIGTPIASSTTVAPVAPITHITGTSSLSTITVPTRGDGIAWTGCLSLIADGAWSTVTGGNIAAAITAVAGTVYQACYDGSSWYLQPVTAMNLAGSGVDSAPYQSAALVTSYITAPSTSGHTFVYGWQPSGSPVAPAAIDFSTYLASPPAIGGTTPAAGTFTTVTSNPPTGDAGMTSWPGNTVEQTIPTHQFAWGGPLSASITAYGYQPSATAPAATQLAEFGAPDGSGWSLITHVYPTALTTAAQCLAATTVTTPCIAYQASATGLAATFSGTAYALYTTSAPSGGVFEFCPTEFQDTGTATPSGQAQMQVTWTTAGGISETGAGLQNITFQTGGGVGNGSCTTVSTAVNTTLSVNMTTVSGVGTVTWEYDLVVRRLK